MTTGAAAAAGEERPGQPEQLLSEGAQDQGVLLPGGRPELRGRGQGPPPGIRHRETQAEHSPDGLQGGLANVQSRGAHHVLQRVAVSEGQPLILTRLRPAPRTN